MRFNPNGTVSRCGHMISPPQFSSLEEMESSEWLVNIKNQFRQETWPNECHRCQQTESVNNTSIRLNSIKLDESESQKDYLQIGGVLDNVCNSACQTCSAQCSTTIGKLMSKTYLQINNVDKFWRLPQHRIIHLDINGGEPSVSQNYKHLLENLPPNLKTLRVNTNCAVMLPILRKISSQGIKVTVTVSFDGIDLVHNYVRWPIKWDKFRKNLLEYKSYNLHDLNLWTTVNTLNINDLANILEFAKEHSIGHSYGILSHPLPLNINYSNHLTIRAKKMFESSTDPFFNQFSTIVAIDVNNQLEFDGFVEKQDRLRGIKIKDFIN
jgi:sulfatase maturation enzyme AslB (radical SAM superfamily)